LDRDLRLHTADRHGHGVYIAAHAEQVADPKDAVVVFSYRSLAHGDTEWGPERVQETAHLRLYRAVASQHFMLDPDHKPDQRTPVAV
jgi:hypothetical protein